MQGGEFCFLIHSANLCLLIRELRPLIFKVIIGRNMMLGVAAHTVNPITQEAETEDLCASQGYSVRTF